MINFSCKEKTNEVMKENETHHELKLSLAQWSFHRALGDKKMDHLDFIKKAGELGFQGVEYVNQFFADKATDTTYLRKMTETANAAGIKQLLIMIDNEGFLGDIDEKKRLEAVNNHKKWIDAAKFLGCHSIRVNAHGEGAAEQVAEQAIKSMTELGTYAKPKNINVIIENHGGYSSNGDWISSLMKNVNMDNVGLLPDFGNFCLKREEGQMWGTKCLEEYDKYKGVEQMMPWAKSVSAKSYDFDANGNETKIDYKKMSEIIKKANYTGYVGVEYEGETIGEEEGVKATKALLEKVWASKM